MRNFILYSDGACSGNPGPGGWATIIYNSHEHTVHELGGGDPTTTNNRMEMTGCLEGLIFIHKFLQKLGHQDMFEAGTHVHIYTDSTYLIYGATRWMKGWKSRGWKNSKGDEISNPDIWQQFDEVLAALRALPHLAIHWHYVPGHQGIQGNERCDEIAVGFSKGEMVYLFVGESKEYQFDIATPPPEFPIPEMNFDRAGSVKSEGAFYLSSVGGIVYRHKTWDSCERRVKGVAATKYKKLKSDLEIPGLLESWGLKKETAIKDSE